MKNIKKVLFGFLCLLLIYGASNLMAAGEGFSSKFTRNDGDSIFQEKLKSPEVKQRIKEPRRYQPFTNEFGDEISLRDREKHHWLDDWQKANERNLTELGKNKILNIKNDKDVYHLLQSIVETDNNRELVKKYFIKGKIKEKNKSIMHEYYLIIKALNEYLRESYDVYDVYVSEKLKAEVEKLKNFLSIYKNRGRHWSDYHNGKNCFGGPNSTCFGGSYSIYGKLKCNDQMDFIKNWISNGAEDYLKVINSEDVNIKNYVKSILEEDMFFRNLRDGDTEELLKLKGIVSNLKDEQSILNFLNYKEIAWLDYYVLSCLLKQGKLEEINKNVSLLSDIAEYVSKAYYYKAYYIKEGRIIEEGRIHKNSNVNISNVNIIPDLTKLSESSIGRTEVGRKIIEQAFYWEENCSKVND